VKYLVTWRQRPAGSAMDYEAAQKRVLELFSRWEQPEGLVFHQFLVRLGEFGGCAVVETDDPGHLQHLTTIFAVFEFTVEVVLDVMDAVAVEQDAIAWRERG
jgi:hypothetical protein